jgi:RND family efflux transporter MFP subunit
MLKKIKFPSFISSLSRHTWWIILSALVLVSACGFAYYRMVYTPAQAEDEPGLQTATVRRGDLVLYASGTGTLLANEVELGFGSGGIVTEVYIQVGDQVEAGDLLAQIDDTEAQIKVTQARRSLLELTSVAAIADAQEQLAQAEIDLDDAINHLEYLISPTVVYWEFEIEEAEKDHGAAQSAAEAAPKDEDLAQQLKDAEAYLQYAEASLVGAWASYEKNYLPANFTVRTVSYVNDRRHVTKYVAAPTETDILEARASVAEAEARLEEAGYLYDILTGEEVPEDATGAGLSELEGAQLDLRSAQVALDETRIYATISGTVTSVDLVRGDTVGTETVISITDLDHPYLEIFLDETDWEAVAVGYEVEVIFDILPERIYNGEVTQVDPVLYTSNNTSVVRALVLLDELAGGLNLPIGTSAAVDVIGGRAEDALLVPVEALRESSPGEYAVFVFEDEKPKLRVVEIGLQDLFYAEVLSGLEAGEVVSTGIVETE